jgi:hypothetical protein
MRRIKARLAIACICAVATALFAGVAFAGNGKDDAPGQVKQDGTPAQPAAQLEAQADASVASASSTTTSNGAVQNGDANRAVAGMKPESSTTSTKWTTCDPTGGTPSAATCPSTHGTAQAAVKTDASKRYGNAQTAAQIAVSRGGSGVKLTGPGNSQPHKVSTCLHKSNPSGGVDVHAIKNYSSAACTPTQTQQVLTSSVCGSKTVTRITTTSQAALHGKSKHHVSSTTSSSTVVTPTAEVCTTSTPGEVAQSSSSNVTPVTVVTPATTAAATAGTTAALAKSGSVAGAQAPFTPPTVQHAPKATKAQHGVLGTVAKVSGSTLPFTGFPLWVALVVALGLIGTGLTLRRRGSTLRVQ